MNLLVTIMAAVLSVTSLGCLALAFWAVWLMHRHQPRTDIQDAKDLASACLQAYQDGRSAKAGAVQRLLDKLRASESFGRVRGKAKREASADPDASELGDDDGDDESQVLMTYGNMPMKEREKE